MKNLFISALFAVSGGMAYAQQTGQNDQDRIQQQTQPATQRTVERSAKVDAAAKKAESEFQAEKQAKDKGMTQKQTSGEKPVSDTVTPVKEPRFQIQDVKRPDNQ